MIGQKFVAFYIKKNRVLQVAGMGNSSDILTWQEAMGQNVMPTAGAIISGEETAQTVFKKLKQSKGKGGCKREHCCKKKNIAA